jgi:hypothetical protein
VQLRLLGTEPQVSEIELLNAPDCGVAETVKVPDNPACMVSEPGEAFRETVGVGPGAGVGVGVGLEVEASHVEL